MGKKVKVALYGVHNKAALIDSEATEGATIGKNLRLPNGTLVTINQIINNTTTVVTTGGPVSVSPSLWSLILNIPAFIANLAALAATGFVVRSTVGGAAELRQIQGETGRINVADGDGVAGNPVVSLGPWPTINPTILVGEIATVPAGHQMFVNGFIDVAGELDIEAGAELVVLEDQPEADPTDPNFTYMTGLLSQIDYASGEQKVFTYNGSGQLIQVDYLRDGWTFRKEFTYTGGGDLDFITETYV